MKELEKTMHIVLENCLREGAKKRPRILTPGSSPWQAEGD